MAVKPIPEGYHSVTPYLIVPDAARLIDFMEQAPPDIKSSARFCISTEAVKICEINEYNVSRRSR